MEARASAKYLRGSSQKARLVIDMIRGKNVNQALAILRSVRGDNHPDYANSLNNIASLYQAMGRYDKAEAPYTQALEIRRRVLGDNHPAYAQSLNAIAMLYQAMGVAAASLRGSGFLRRLVNVDFLQSVMRRQGLLEFDASACQVAHFLIGETPAGEGRNELRLQLQGVLVVDQRARRVAFVAQRVAALDIG